MTEYNFTKLPTKTPGLKYVPLLISPYMDFDGPFGDVLPKDVGPIGFTPYDKNVLETEMARVKPKFIMEIGVSTDVLKGSTSSILENKSEAHYLGIDITNQEWVTRYPNARILRTTSSDRHTITEAIKEIGLGIDLFMIDGWHSVNAVLQEWNYTEFLSPNGVVIFHDVSVHPGPRLIFEAIDEALYEKLIFDNPHDWGIGIARRKSA